MGAQLSTVAPTATVPIDAYVAELGDLTYSGDLGRSRFLKTVRATHREGFAVVKVFIRPTTDQLDITHQREEVQKISNSLRHDLGPLNSFPNAIGYSRIVETERAGYLVRQYIKHNLYDRISTRPFLEPVEKRWIAYQLLRAVQSCHEHGIKHGDIKSENVLVGSWKWIYLTDFAPFKPITLPENDTAQFLFYFDVSQRRVCYVAPERFSDSGPTELTCEMDIYSAGCVIAELFMDGQPLFSLADLFKYKRGEWMPDWTSISEDKGVQEMVSSMVSVDPKMRKSAGEYLSIYKNVLFPAYFDVLWDLLASHSSSVGATSSNEMIKHLWTHFKSDVLQNGLKVYDDLELVSELPSAPLPVVVPLPPDQYILPKHRHVSKIPDDCGALIVLSYVCSSLTATSSVEWRLKAAYLLLALAEFVPDDVKLDRCLPYLVLLLRDSQVCVRVAALPLIAHLLSMVKEYSPLNARVYTAYLFPRISQAVNTSSPAELRAILASCLPSLAESAVECEGWEAVVSFVNETARFLLVDKVAIVRRSLLTNADALCSVLRKQGTNDIILLHAITYLNDKDPYVRMDLFRFIAKVAPLVGVATIEQYVAPLMMQSLCDPREDLVGLILQSLGTMIEIGLIRLKSLLGTVVPTCAKFLIHPNVYIRTQTLILIANTAKHLSRAQCYCLLRPQLGSYLIGEVDTFTDHGTLAESLKSPITQPVYSLTLRWAGNATKSRFWMPANQPEAGNSSMATFSQEDKRWLSSLREVGFNNEDLWQLLVFREYIWQLSRVPHPTTPLPSELESRGTQSNTSISSNSNSEYSGPAVTSVSLPNGSNRLTSQRGLSSWHKGSAMPPGLSRYIMAHRDEEDSEEDKLIIGGKIYSKSSLLVEAAQSGDNATRSIDNNNDNANATTNNTARPNDSIFDDSSSSSLASTKSRVRMEVHGALKVPSLERPIPSTLVSSMKAHRGAVNVLVTHMNNRHFITAADDAIIKLWDIRLLLKGSSKPVSTYELSSPVSVCHFLADTSVLAFSTEDSTVGFLKYSFKKNDVGVLVYNGHTLIGSLKMDVGGKAVALHGTDSLGVSPEADTFNGTVSKLWVLNSSGFLLKIDLASLEVVEKLELPQEHGTPTCWVWDVLGDWVIVGTLHGMLDLFDMRFSLHVNSFGIGDLEPITSMDAHPLKERQICVAGGFHRNVVSVWDIEKLECREVLLPVSDLDEIDDDSDVPSLEPMLPSNNPLAERFARWNIGEGGMVRKKPPVTSMRATRKLGGHGLLTGGGDRMLRMWDLRSPYQSACISGFNHNRGKPAYMGKVGSQVRFTYESWSPAKGTERLARNAIISNEEQDIGRNHRGCITDVGLLEQNNGRVVSISVDEIGMIKVFT